MKFTIAIAATVLGFVGAVPAGADTISPLEINQSETPASETPNVSGQSQQTTSEQLNHLETQINQDVSGDRGSSRPQTPLSNLDEVLNLPEGVVVRGTQRGGLAIGGEF